MIPRNNRRKGPFLPVAIGKNMRVKVNANLGTSPERCDFTEEMKKVRKAVSAGADALMDLSIPGRSGAFRRQIMEEFGIPLGTVPLYQAAGEGTSPEDLSFEDFAEVLRAQAEEGVDFMTIHAGLRKEHLPLIEETSSGSGKPGRFASGLLDAATWKREFSLRTLRPHSGNRERVRHHPSPWVTG